jgi:hypothetical protein
MAVETTARIMFGFFGAILLLVPLVVLTFIANIHYRLLATTLFALVFAIILSIFSKASNTELAGATAAYVAVLVVFVGSS